MKPLHSTPFPQHSEAREQPDFTVALTIAIGLVTAAYLALAF